MAIWVAWVGRGIENLEIWMVEGCQLRIEDLDLQF